MNIQLRILQFIIRSNWVLLFLAATVGGVIAPLDVALGIVAGGLIVTQPTYQDWNNPELNPYLEKYMGGAGNYTAEERMKLMSMLHHVVASDFAGWHEVCTIHAEGSFAAQKMMLMAEAPMDMYKNRAKEVVGLNV